MANKYTQTFLHVPPAIGEVVFIASSNTEEARDKDFNEKYEVWKNGDGSGLQESVKENTKMIYGDATEEWKSTENSPIIRNRSFHIVEDGGPIILDSEKSGT